MSRKAFVYILECGDGSLYTGWTYDVKKRYQEHRAGKGGRYTRTHLPVKLVYVKEMRGKVEAMQWEYRIKQMDRSTKLKLVDRFRAQLEEYLSARRAS